MATEIRPRLAKPKMVSTFVSQRYLDIGDNKRGPGELVPETPTWLRYEHLVNCGYIKEVEVPEADFIEAVERYCPDLVEQIAPLVGITVKKMKEKRNG